MSQSAIAGISEYLELSASVLASGMHSEPSFCGVLEACSSPSAAINGPDRPRRFKPNPGKHGVWLFLCAVFRGRFAVLALGLASPLGPFLGVLQGREDERGPSRASLGAEFC